MKVLILLSLFWASSLCAGPWMDQFIHFTSPNGIQVQNALLVPSIITENVGVCGGYCLNNTACVSFSFSNVSGACEQNGYSMRYTVVEGVGNGYSYYLRIIVPYNDPANPKINYLLQTPLRGVKLGPGVFANVFDNALSYLSEYDADDLLYYYRVRAGVPNPPGQCWGWDANLKGSISGLFMMGTGNALRWVENSTLSATLNAIVEGIKECQGSDGYIMAYERNDTMAHENPDYVLSWVTHGLIEADLGGNPIALQLIRDHLDWFNYNQYLPEFMPSDTLLSDVPPQFGAPAGHQIYLIYQGIIHNTRMANSRLGRQRDVDVVATLYQENEWLTQLVSKNLSGIWQKQWFPHNYEVTAFEAYLDMYVVTGNVTYLNAILGAWEMFYEYWIHVGGSMAINEGSPDVWYPPGSFYIDCTYGGVEIPQMTPPACSGPSLNFHSHSSIEQPLDGCHATGETCGSSFWIRLNQRFHRLYPDEEKYVTEIERELYNVITANQAGSSGNRYFANLHKYKQQPSNVGSCCETQGVRTWGSMPEFIYSFSEAGIYVDLYASSTITWQFNDNPITITMDTAFPYSNNVTLTVSTSGSVTFELAIRSPSWATGPSSIVLNGKPIGAVPPGNYAKITQAWGKQDIVQITLEQTFIVTKYTGLSQITPYSRWAYQYGPVLLAVTGPFDPTTDCVILKGLDPTNPSTWMIPLKDQPLYYNVSGNPGYQFVPYMEIQNEMFTVYPIILSS